MSLLLGGSCAASPGDAGLPLPAVRDASDGPARRVPDAERRERERALAELVDEALLARRVRELVALGPRMGGTRSGARAARLREELFRSFGLATRRIEGPPAWCHAEELAAAAIVAGERVALERAWPFGFSPDLSARAPVSLEPRAGHVLLTAEPPDEDERPLDGVPAVLVDGVTTPDGSWPLARALPRDAARPVVGLSAPEGARLRAALAAGEPVEVDLALDSTVERAAPVTVVASLPARRGAPEGYFLFCAHGDSDSGGPGANDNASGEAIVLEIARVWTLAVERGLLPPPRREVRFAVWGTEIASTRHFLAEHADEGGPLLGVVNYDQAGFGSGSDQLNVEPDDLPANEALVRAVWAVLEENAGRPGFPERFATNKSLGGTDSYVFSGSETFREEGRPAVTLFASAWSSPEEHPRTPEMPGESWSDRDVVSVDYDVFYHSAGDLPRNTTDREPFNMGWGARAGLLGVLRWLERLERESGGGTAPSPAGPSASDQSL